MTAAQVRPLRIALKMTQEQLARILDVTVSTVNRWENARTEPSRLARAAMDALAEQHGVTLAAAHATKKPPAP